LSSGFELRLDCGFCEIEWRLVDCLSVIWCSMFFWCRVAWVKGYSSPLNKFNATSFVGTCFNVWLCLIACLCVRLKRVQSALYTHHLI
jgi:hypothetical protein